MKKNLKQLATDLIGLVAKWYYAFLCFAIMMWTGCSLIGYGIGSAIGSKHKKEKTVAGWQMQTVEIDQELSLLTKDFDLIKGKYKGMYSVPDEEYLHTYELQRAQKSNDLILPSIGDTILISLKNKSLDEPQKKFKYLFAGFDINNLLVRAGINTRIGHVPFSIMEEIIDQKGNTVNGNKLNELVNSNQLPSKSLIIIESMDSTRMITPADVIQLTTKSKSSNAALTGFLIGAGIDIAVVALTIASNQKKDAYIPPPPPPTTPGRSWGGSCPYVYSFDGSQYILDSETFGGAIYKAAQRTDLDNLDHLKEINGSYKLKLTNELEETQYIDEFKLLLVDHPIGTKVFPDFIGKLHILSELNPPIKATDKNGNDVLDLVKSKDQQIWVSNPFVRNPDKKGDGRDAMILEFNKPPHATHVKLSFNVQNSVWAAHMQEVMLSLHGNKLNDWYTLMNSSKIAQATFKQIMIREGMLLIQLWDGQEWKTRDYVWEVGPSVAKDQVVELDLGNYFEQNLRIRLESTVGFWMINSVEADYSIDVPFNITELSANKAIDQSGNNILEILKNIDEQYYAMPSKQDWADISFHAIPQTKNRTRSFILKCNGYYTIHADESGEPQQELLTKLISEPGAYGQYTLRVLNQNISSAFQENFK